MTVDHLKEHHPDIYNRYLAMVQMMYEDAPEADDEEWELNGLLTDLYAPSENDMEDLYDHCQRELGIA